MGIITSIKYLKACYAQRVLYLTMLLIPQHHILISQIDNIISKYHLESGLLSLSKDHNNKLEPLSFQSQSKKIVHGFQEFLANKSGILINAQLSENLSELNRFIFIFESVILSLEQQKEIDHCKNRFTESCKNKEKFIGFYHEIKTLSKLINEGFKIIKLPEAFPGNSQTGESIPDAIVSKGGKRFQVECKTISHRLGHPILEDAFYEFLTLLWNDHIYQEICLEDYFYHISYEINARLYSSKPKNREDDRYITPFDLLKQFKQDHKLQKDNVTIKKSFNQGDAHHIENDIELLSQQYQVIYAHDGYYKTHQLTLKSTINNEYEKKLFNKIKEEVNRKIDKNQPLIFCIELYEFIDCEIFRLFIMNLIYEHKDKLLRFIVSDRVPVSCSMSIRKMPWSIEHFFGRNTLEIQTKAMSQFMSNK